MDEDKMSDMLNQFQHLLNSDQMPDNLKDLLTNLQSNSPNHSESSSSKSTSSSASSPELDLNMIIKLKSIMDQMNTSSDDPRSNLLISLKPYLKPSRKEKVDQYIGLLRMSKVFDVMNLSNGEKKHE